MSFEDINMRLSSLFENLENTLEQIPDTDSFNYEISTALKGGYFVDPKFGGYVDTAKELLQKYSGILEFVNSTITGTPQAGDPQILQYAEKFRAIESSDRFSKAKLIVGINTYNNVFFPSEDEDNLEISQADINKIYEPAIYYANKMNLLHDLFYTDTIYSRGIRVRAEEHFHPDDLVELKWFYNEIAESPIFRSILLGTWHSVLDERIINDMSGQFRGVVTKPEQHEFSKPKYYNNPSSLKILNQEYREAVHQAFLKLTE